MRIAAGALELRGLVISSRAAARNLAPNGEDFSSLALVEMTALALVEMTALALVEMTNRLKDRVFGVYENTLRCCPTATGRLFNRYREVYRITRVRDQIHHGDLIKTPW
jgi:hypothetical protein